QFAGLIAREVADQERDGFARARRIGGQVDTASHRFPGGAIVADLGAPPADRDFEARAGARREGDRNAELVFERLPDARLVERGVVERELDREPALLGARGA